MLLDRDDSVLLIVDIQERLLPVIAGGEAVVANAAILIRAARRLGIPLMLSEQYPQGLGRTVSDIAALCADTPVFEKISFSCAGCPALMEHLDASGKKSVVIAGTEAHVCVQQTVLDLLARGYRCHVVADAVSSRTVRNRRLAVARMRQSGADIVTAEMAVFEWLRRADDKAFRELSGLIK